MGRIGVIGLGNMGGALAANLVATGNDVLTHDLAGAGRNPEGATFFADVEALAAEAESVVLSLPDGRASSAVTSAIAQSPARQVRNIVDTSTIGPAAAREIAAALQPEGIGYVDAPVSGGPAGVRARTLLVMYAGPVAACDAVLGVLEGLSDRRLRVGDAAGMAQGVKLANNFLVAASLAATSEAVAFTTALGIDMETVLEVINASSGRSAVSEDKFVNHVLTGSFNSGFANTLMSKDVRLYLDSVTSMDSPAILGEVATQIWSRFADARPGDDFTAIYPFTTDP